MNQTPLVFLVLAVLTFLIGFVLYTYSSSQGKMVTFCATITTSVAFLILVIIILWEVGELRWHALRFHQISQEMEPRVPMAPDQIGQGVGLGAIRRLFRWLFAVISRAREFQAVLPMAAKGGVRTWEGSRSLDVHQGNDDAQPHRQIPSSPRESESMTTQNIDPGPLTVSREYDPKLQKLRTIARRVAQDQKKKDFVAFPTVMGLSDLESLARTEYQRPLYDAGPVEDLRFAPDGEWIAALFMNGVVGIWRIDGNRLNWFGYHLAYEGSLVWSQEKCRLLYPVQGGVGIWSGVVRHAAPEATTYTTDLMLFSEGEVRNT